MAVGVQSKMRVECPQCGKALNVAVSAAGKKGRCPGWQHTFEIPLLAEVTSEPPLPRNAVPGLTLLDSPGSLAATEMGLTPLDPSWSSPLGLMNSADSLGNLNELQYLQSAGRALPTYP